MSERLVIPQYLTLLASPVDWVAFLRTWPDKGELEQRALKEAVDRRGFLTRGIHLRWLLSGALGLPREPFTVWRRPSTTPKLKTLVSSSPTLSSSPIVYHYSSAPLAWVKLVVDAGAGTGSILARAFNQAGQLLMQVQQSGPGTLTVEVYGNQIARLELSGTGTLKNVAGITAAAFVLLKDWQAVEIVGLPVDKTGWGSTGYNTGDQGLIGALVPPEEAARQRLGRGAPPFGWQPTLDTGAPAPTWLGPDHIRYIRQLQKFILPPVQHMLEALSSPLSHPDYVESIPLADPIQQGSGGGENYSGSTAELPALGNMLLGAGSDTHASLGLGFGTALAVDAQTERRGNDYMVTVLHKIFSAFELADFVIRPQGLPVPAQPTSLVTTRDIQVPPTVVDGPWSESVSLKWTRVEQVLPSDGRVCGYGVARYRPGSSVGEVLLDKYPMTTGWAPFVPTEREEDPTRVYFSDGYLPAPSDPAQRTYRYGIAAADLFGRYSPWLSRTYDFGVEPIPRPTLLKTLLKVDENSGSGTQRSASLEVDFTWDWTWRTAQRIEFRGAFVDSPPNPPVPANVQTSSTGSSPGILYVEFGGVDAPTTVFPGTTVTNIDTSPPPAPPAANVRQYRLKIDAQVDFAGVDMLPYTFYARGYQHILPGTASAWSNPATGAADSPVPPIAPTPPEYPIWSSLPDVAGVSRVTLSWSASPGTPPAGYVLYQASEAALLQEAGLASPELTQGYVERLAVLRDPLQMGVTLSDLRRTFTRVQQGLIKTTSFEVSLPRGTTSLQLFVITAISNKNVESAWPSALTHFFAVAVPRVVVPRAPRIEVTKQLSGGSTVARVSVSLPPGPKVSRVQLFRASSDLLAGRLDHMGSQHSDSNSVGWNVQHAADGVSVASATFDDSSVASSWQRTWYRAVSWTADEPTAGIYGARSEPSAGAWVLIPPADPPVLTGAAQDGSSVSGGSLEAVLFGVSASAPVLPTPIGAHTIRVVVNSMTPDANGRVPARIDSSQAALQELTALTGNPPLHPAGTCLGMLYRDGSAGSSQRYRCWVRRPSGTPAGTKFQVWIFMTDPLNRSSNTSFEVEWT